MWMTLASVALVAAFAWFTLQLLRHSREVGVELSIHRRARLSRRLQNLVFGCAAVAIAAVALQAGVALHVLDLRAEPLDISRKPITLRFDPHLHSMPSAPTPAVAAVEDVALTATAR
jgi:hypothetical protein